MPQLPNQISQFLKKASLAQRKGPRFSCTVFQTDNWNRVTEEWASKAYVFLEEALGLWGKEPLPEIRPLSDGMHAAWATASFDPNSGQVRLSPSIENNIGMTLEKVTHEFLHASLAKFPEGDPFYEEGFVDYLTWVLAHAPVWEPYQTEMIEAASSNIRNRRERAFQDQSDYDRKRWAGGLYANLTRGPFLLSTLRLKKQEGNHTW